MTAQTLLMKTRDGVFFHELIRQIAKHLTQRVLESPHAAFTASSSYGWKTSSVGELMCSLLLKYAQVPDGASDRAAVQSRSHAGLSMSAPFVATWRSSWPFPGRTERRKEVACVLPQTECRFITKECGNETVGYVRSLDPLEPVLRVSSRTP
jgi:hypothetical protein